MGIPLRILIIEDNADDAALMVRELEHGGYEVTWQRVDRREQMQAALVRQPWDVVLSDHGMPNFNSRAALQMLREGGHDIPFILVSGMTPEEAHVLVKELNVHDCLLKSEVDEVLVHIVSRQLQAAEERRRGNGKS
jgi:CheY-like chemotaxis protein